MTSFQRTIFFGFIAVLCLAPCRRMRAADSPDEADTTRVRNSGVDTVVVFSAKDSVHFSVSKRRMRLRGDADVTFRTQRLESEVIIMDFGPSTMRAEGMRDSSGRLYGVPLFTDAGEQYAGQIIEYNFASRRGRVVYGETEVDGAFYYGSKIKRVSENVAFVEDGCLTTCDAPHPHFYFKAPEMKVIMNDRLFMDPIVWYVEDIPVFALPFGMFVSLERGRRSGLLIPTPLVSGNRGVVLQDLGYYFALSDYYDVDIRADVMSAGGILLKSRSNYKLNQRLDGHLDLRYGYTRFSSTDGFTQNVGVNLVHQQSLRPGESISANIEYASENLFQNTSFNIPDRLRQIARSNASYQRTFYNGHTFNLVYDANQNIQNGSLTQNPSVAYTVPQFSPLRGVVSPDSWLSDVALSYSVRGLYSHDQSRFTSNDPFTITENSRIEHRPTITMTPKLGFFTIAPTLQYSENWHFQEYVESVRAVDSTVERRRVPGFFRDYTYSAGVNISTFLYGMFKPGLFGISAFRHTLQPTIGIFYVPNQAVANNAFFGEYVSPVTGQTVRYNRFNTMLASANEQFRIDVGLVNRFAMKLEQTDTLEQRPIELLTVNLNTSYNAAADSLQLSPISIGIRAPVLEGITFAANATLNPYLVEQRVDPATGRLQWQTVNTLALTSGMGLGTLTNVNLQIGTRFSSQGLSFAPTGQDTVASDTAEAEGLRSRFSRRLNHRARDSDIFGEATPGYSPVIIPWEVDLNLTYSSSNPNPDARIETLLLNVGGSLSLTETLRMNGRASVDMFTGTVNTPVIDIAKRIHCWSLALNWVPTGFNRGFFLTFSADASQLRDLRITKQSTPIFR